ncbi:unnamed protein product [Spirodela intermedia]|uniref:AIG1-type G domain-containing protein n=1 Tax=Spirodela intermedia TaxID=51605 RepID=A0A7I8IKL3_SPIIN|nr:unnamed protein product [Spirodela intermedia]CAA6658421.1 unnamed protein product [Spirodela intermedia]
MKALKEWISRQLESSSVLSSVRPLSFIERESSDEAIRDQGAPSPLSYFFLSLLPSSPFPVSLQWRRLLRTRYEPLAVLLATSGAGAGAAAPLPGGLDNLPAANNLGDAAEVLPPAEVAASEVLPRRHHHLPAPWRGSGDPLANVEQLQVKFLRLAHRMGISPGNRMVAQVLYRLQLAGAIRSGEADSERPSLKISEARDMAAAMEAAGQADLDFSFKILLLGKTGVGKSATINSIFDQEMAEISAFEPATRRIREIAGTVKGIRVTTIDTPGLSPSSSHSSQRHNRRVMLSIRRFIKRSPPDVVLYFDRLNGAGTAGGGDLLLLKLVTDVLGSSIWFNAILVFTHSSAVFEGPSGSPVSHESLLNQCANLIQHCINQAISDTRLEIPVLSVENDPSCRTNTAGEKVLPNGQPWRLEFLLLCASMKVLVDANAMLRFQNTIQVGRRRNSRAPSLPHLLSSLLQPRPTPGTGGSDGLLAAEELAGVEDEGDDYDELPPFRALSRAQFQKLPKSQKNDYLDELDYRETLYLKKQLKEELRRRRRGPNLATARLQKNFDPNCPVYRYRSLAHDDQWPAARPVLDSQGWDHDIGFDGVNVEVSGDLGGATRSSLVGQVNKDKKDCSFLAECATKYSPLSWCDLSAEADFQTAGRSRGRRNAASCGVSLTSLSGEVSAVGAKVEDSVQVARRFSVSASSGFVRGQGGAAACGGGLEATFLGRDYPARDDRATLGLTLLAFDREVVLGGALRSDFRASRTTRMAVNASLNSRSLGRLSLKTTTSQDVQIALLGLAISLLQGLLRRRLAAAAHHSGDDDTLQEF